MRQGVSQLLQQCERLLALDEKLPDVLNGEAEPVDATEWLALGQLCQQCTHRHAAAARFLRRRLRRRPEARRRFAPAAPLQRRVLRRPRRRRASRGREAPAGQGATDAEAASAGLAANDLALYVKLVEREEPAAKQTVRQRLGHWREDADLVSVRDREALAKLPEAEPQGMAEAMGRCRGGDGLHRARGPVEAQRTVRRNSDLAHRVC